MLGLLIFILVVAVVAALLVAAVRQIGGIPAPFPGIIVALILVIAAVAILMRALPLIPS